MPDPCYRCGSTSFDHSDGQVICNGCGTVVEESNIVSDVTFVEAGDGSSSVVGQFVSSSGQRSYGGRGLPGVQRPTREITLANGRRRIAQLAQSLHLKPQHVDAAQRLFMLAVQHNFTQGRRSQHVVAACLYIVCRRQKTPHMLIDFSDVLQVNVYVLGQTFLRLCQVLNIQPPVIDPSLYIHRFAAKLEFDDKEHEVATTALRIVQRMNRDWIQTGRRPAGICGAALMISARLHGFQRTQKEIVNVVNICELTLRKRLVEFENTAAASQTFEDFQDESKDDDIAPTDPPAFRRARLLEELEAAKKAGDTSRAEEIQEQIQHIDRPKRVKKPAVEAEHEASESEPPPKKAKRSQKRKRGADASSEDVDDSAEEAAKTLVQEHRRVTSLRAAKRQKVDSDSAVENEENSEESEYRQPRKGAKTTTQESKPKKSTKKIKAEKIKAQKQQTKKTPVKLEIDIAAEEDPKKMEAEMQSALKEHGNISAKEVSGPLLPAIADVDIEDGVATAPTDTQTAHSSTQDTQHPIESTPQNAQSGRVGDDEGNFEDVDDAEIQMYFATEAEKETKTSIWEEANRDWLEKQEEKARLRAAQEEMDALVDGKKKRAPKKKKAGAATTPAEAAANAIQKKVPTRSEKVNYSGLKIDLLFQRLGEDAAAYETAPAAVQDDFAFPTSPAPRQRRIISSLGDVMESSTTATYETPLLGQSGQFVAPVTAYRSKASSSFATPNVAAEATVEDAGYEGGDYYDDGDEYYQEGESGYAQNDYEAEYARMKESAANAEDEGYYEDDYY